MDVVRRELIAFSRIFGIDVEELLQPVDVVLNRAVVSAFEEWAEASARAGRANAEQEAALERFRAVVRDQDGGEIRDALEKAIRRWVVSTYPTAEPDEAVEYFTLTFAGVPKHDPRWQAHYARARESLTNG